MIALYCFDAAAVQKVGFVFFDYNTKTRMYDSVLVLVLVLILGKK